MLPILPILLGVVGVATRAVGTIPTLLRKAAAPAVAAVVSHAAQPDGPPPRRRLPKFLARTMYAVVILMFLWEVVGRMILIPIFAPELLLRLPAPMLDQVMELLMTLPVE